MRNPQQWRQSDCYNPNMRFQIDPGSVQVKRSEGLVVRQKLLHWPDDYVQRNDPRLNSCIAEWSDCSSLTGPEDTSVRQMAQTFEFLSRLTWSCIVCAWPGGTCPIIHERWPASSVACSACTTKARMPLGSGLWSGLCHYYLHILCDKHTGVGHRRKARSLGVQVNIALSLACG